MKENIESPPLLINNKIEEDPETSEGIYSIFYIIYYILYINSIYFFRIYSKFVLSPKILWTNKEWFSQRVDSCDGFYYFWRGLSRLPLCNFSMRSHCSTFYIYTCCSSLLLHSPTFIR